MSNILKKLFLIISFFLGFCFADAISVEALQSGGEQIRDNQLKEIHDILMGGRGGYIDFGFNYIPLPTQTPLKSDFGYHDGFAFRHHLAGFGAGEITKNNYLGFLLWFDRSGFDGEDFILFPSYTDFSLVRSVTTWGFTYTQSAIDLTFALGMQHQNLEHAGFIYPDENDSLVYSFAHLRWNHFSAQASFHRNYWRQFRFSLDLESRSIYGGYKSGIFTYLPNLDVTMYNKSDDSISVTWEQNLFKQLFYGELTFEFPKKEFRSAALKYYPDPSRMIGFEATCLRRNVRKGSADLLWGGAIDLLFLRLAYNSSYEYERLYHAKGTFIAEFKFSLSTIDGFLFGRGARNAAPMETSTLEKKNKDNWNKDSGKIDLEKATGTPSKTIEAKGIRYEKSNKGGVSK